MSSFIKLRKRKDHRKPTRECGGCTACCTIVPIWDWDRPHKPANVPCKDVTSTGCGIYSTRPKVCGKFECAWLQNPDWSEELRPDRTNVVYCYQETEVGLGLVLFEGPGTKANDDVAELIIEHTKKMVVVFVRGEDDRMVFGPEHLLKRMKVLDNELLKEQSTDAS